MTTTTQVTVELLHGPGCGKRLLVRIAEMQRSASGVWCAAIPMPHRHEDPALYALGVIEPSTLSPIQVYDAVFVGWSSDFVNPPQEGGAGC